MGSDYGKLDGITREQAQLARERTKFLMVDHIIGTLTLDRLLANAWLCGVADAAEAIGDRPRPMEPVAQPFAPPPEGLG